MKNLITAYTRKTKDGYFKACVLFKESKRKEIQEGGFVYREDAQEEADRIKSDILEISIF